MVEYAVRTPDGRMLAVREAGDLDGPVVVAHHGTPGGRVANAAHVQDAAARGLRLLTYDRPGYGESSAHPGRRVADAATDVAAICGALAIERYATWGVSGGGPHALACAACDARCVAVATIAGAAPHRAGGLDFLLGMAPEDIERFRAWRSGRDAMLARTESAGHADDLLALAHAWGFATTAVSVPAQVWQDGEDVLVPAGHAAWLAAHLPTAADMPQVAPTRTEAVAAVQGWCAALLA